MKFTEAQLQRMRDTLPEEGQLPLLSRAEQVFSELTLNRVTCLDKFAYSWSKWGERHLQDKLFEKLRDRLDKIQDKDTPLQTLSKLWQGMRGTSHEKQVQFWKSQARFIMVPAGRRSGKTAIAKRKFVKRALSETKYDDAWFIACAPTHGQAKRIYWRDLCRLVPPEFVHDVSNSELVIRLTNGADIQVMGMDVPERAEGRSLNGILMDEYGNMKPDVWGEHIRPALADRGGFAWFIGAPEGRNHYYDLFIDALADENWDTFTWTTEEILPLYLGIEQAIQEIASAKHDMDPLTYAQEYLASFVTFTGLAYYQFDRTLHAAHRCPYNPKADLSLCFDFNVAPGVAVATQDRKAGTVCVGEVYIKNNSNTPAVCRKIIEKYGRHEGNIFCYGDATGGNDGSAKVQGSDWDLIKKELRPVFGERLFFRVQSRNWSERVRVNAMNSRLKSTDGTVALYMDPVECKMLIKDFEGVRLLEGGSGEIDKKAAPELTHLTDALGYQITKRFPIHTGDSVNTAEALV